MMTYEKQGYEKGRNGEVQGYRKGGMVKSKGIP